MNAAGLRRLVHPRAPRAALAPIALALLAVACGPGPPSPSNLVVTPSPTTALDAAAPSHAFRFVLTLGTRGLEVGDRVEIWLFASREPPQSALVTLDGGAIDGQLLARAAPRASLRAETPGGNALLQIEALAAIAAGRTIEANIAVGRLPQQGYGLSRPAQLAMPVRIVRADGAVAETFATARWNLEPEAADRLVLRLPSEIEPGDEAPLVLGLLSKEGYGAAAARERLDIELPAGAQWVVPLDAFDADDAGIQEARLRFTAPGVYRLEARAGEFGATSNPIWVRKRKSPVSPEAELRVYWGDLHNHTRYSFDSRNRNLTALSVADSLELARRAALLDFIAITDHGPNGVGPAGFEEPTAMDMPAEDWARYSKELAEARVPGLVVFAGFEHLGARGHTCLVFRDRQGGEYFVQDGRRLALADLWARYAVGSLLSIPHLHPLRGMADFEAGSAHETLVEIVSKWGAYEFYANPDPYAARRRDDAEEAGARAVHERGEKGPFVSDLLAAGKRYGFVGASDHGPPGQYGLTAVLAESATREAIFEALLARRTWATTGTRTWLEFSVSGATFGEIRSLDRTDPEFAAREITLTVHAATAIVQVEILRNGEVWQTATGGEQRDLARSWRDTAPLAEIARARRFASVRSAEYYARVTLADGEMAWGSPVFFELDAAESLEAETAARTTPQSSGANR